MFTWNKQMINAPTQNEQIGRPPAFRGFNFALDRIVNEINQRREGGPPDQPLIGMYSSHPRTTFRTNSCSFLWTVTT